VRSPKFFALILFVSALVACGSTDTSTTEAAARLAISHLQSGDWENYSSMTMNQADLLQLQIGATGGVGSFTDGVLRPQDERRLRSEFERVVKSEVLKGTDPQDFQLDTRLTESDLWIVVVRRANGDPTGVELHLRWWKEGYRVTMALLQ